MAGVQVVGGHVLDPASERDGRFDLLLDRGRIADVQPSLPSNGTTRIDATGMLVVPGLVDLHTHLRQPGREDKETVETGGRAALRGGFTTVCAMPNTDPPADEPSVVEWIHREAQRVDLAAVHVIGAVTRGRAGRDLTNFGELFEAGCVALSDDGASVADSFLMRRALEYARIFNRPIIQHAEDPTLVAGGVMHEGVVSTMLGLRGIPGAAESVMVARDVALAQLTGGWVHFAHISTAASVEIVREAKRRGVRVTCEVTPHHLALTHDAVGEFNTHAKVNPPLRTEEDRQALVAGLCDETIDCIATDHAPHTEWEKDAEFDAAPFGISGLETALGVCVQTLIVSKQLTWPELIAKLTSGPATIAGLKAGTLRVGAEADLVLIDPAAQWQVDPQRFVSKGRHTPFTGRTLTGVVKKVIRRGREVPLA